MIVKYNATNILSIGNTVMGEKSVYRFIPGINLIDKEMWEKVKKHPTIQSKINKGVLKVIQTKDGTEVTKGEPSVNVIAEMFDVLKLDELVKSKNKKVADAATKRLLEIHQPEEEAKGDE